MGQGLWHNQNVYPTNSITKTLQDAGAARKPLSDGDGSDDAPVRSLPGISP